MTFARLQRIAGLLATLYLALAFAAGGASAGLGTQDKAYRLTILHTNDHHGNFMPGKYGEYGLAARKTDDFENEALRVRFPFFEAGNRAPVEGNQ